MKPMIAVSLPPSLRVRSMPERTAAQPPALRAVTWATALWAAQALSLAGAGLLPAPAHAQSQAAAPAPAQGKAAMTVQVVGVQVAEMAQTLAVNGSIAAWSEAVVASQVQGLRLVELTAQVGDVVAAGQLLARFDEVPVQHDLAQARATLQEAQAQGKEAAANAQRARSLSGTGALSAQQQGQFEAAEAVALARIATAQAMVAAQELRLQNTRVTAPDAGAINARVAQLGAVAAPGQELFRIIRQGRLEWRAEVPAADLARIKPGAPAQLSTPAGAKVTGSVRRIAPQVDAQSRNGLVYVDLKVPEGADARAGMFARGEFRLDARRVATLPASALLLRDGFDVVLVVDDKSRVRQTKVKVVGRDGERVGIEGLAEGAKVVERGGAFLADGDLVKVVGAAR